MTEQQKDLMLLLPDDLLADVLHRLAPRGLAASRCVCKAWRAVIDVRRLLRPDLLPHSLGGIFFNFFDLHNWWFPQFLSRPSVGPRISGKLDRTLSCNPDGYTPCTLINDHCNGLLLIDHCVVNPATRQWARLPPRPSTPLHSTPYYYGYLVFDPTVSPHYEVFRIPRFNYPRTSTDESEWPPSPYILHVFSSRTGQWEERTFIREGEATGTIADMRFCMTIDHFYTVYWRGALYVHCQTDFVMRISMSNHKYRVIEPPIVNAAVEYRYFHLGKSEKGVYFALLHDRFHLKVWLLNESCSQMEWVLKHDSNVEHALPRRNYGEQSSGPWILENVNCNQDYHEEDNKADDDEDGNKKDIVVEKFEWDSDNDNVLDIGDRVEEPYSGYISILGLHPYKEIVFLSEGEGRVLAYHLTSSKVQDLGNLCTKSYLATARHPFIDEFFPYTPCWTGELPGKFI